MPTTAGVGLLIVSVLLSGSGKTPDYCEEELLRGSARSPQAYQFRENRCEGEYAQHVSATGLNLRSLTRDLGNFDPSEGMELSWKVPPGVGSDGVRVLALSLRPRTYFRMDTKVPAKSESFQWPGDVLEAFDLSAEEIGIRAWVTLPGPGGTVRDVYLPVGLGKNSTLGSKDGYQICLWPNNSLKEIRLSVAQIDAQGNVTKWLRQNEAVDLDYIPSDEPACFSSGSLDAPGYYRLKLAATARSGGLAVEEIDLYHT